MRWYRSNEGSRYQVLRNKKEVEIIHTSKHRGVILWMLASRYWDICRLEKELHGAMALISKNSLDGTGLSRGI